MRALWVGLVCLGLSGCTERSTALAAGPEVPVVVELFTSEGCSSCPAAERTLAELVLHPPAGTRILPIEFHVDYWDYLGHADRFASATFTERQRSYSRTLGTSSMYTPQAVVDGKIELVGSDRSALVAAVTTAARAAHASVNITRAGESISVSTDLPESAKSRVLVVEVEKNPSNHVARGENAGRTLQHTWVASRVHDLGEWHGSVPVNSPALGVGPHRAAIVLLAGPAGIRGSGVIALE